MNLYEAAKQYTIYLQTLHLSREKMSAYRSALRHTLHFYGPETDLRSFDNPTVLKYIEENDPFDCDPLHTERGTIFCNFVHWLMRNRMIPAWQKEMAEMEQEQAVNRQEVRRYAI